MNALVATSWTASQLDALRQQTDPLADDFVARMLRDEGPDAVHQLFARLIEQVNLPITELPADLKAFISEASDFPAWADPVRLRRAEQVFLDHGPLFLLLLYYRSLPTLYVCRNGVQVLHLTGRLAPARDNHLRFRRRIAETAQVLLDVMDEGGLRAFGPGLQSLLRVRLIHAAIRAWLPKDQWEESWGQPINQEDMAITLMTFSVSLLDGATALGITISPSDQEAYFHAWQVAGWFLGVNPVLIPADLTAGRRLHDQILQRQAAPSPEGKALTQALLDFASTALPGERWDLAPVQILYQLSGPELAGMLGITPPNGCLPRLLPGILWTTFRKNARWEQRHPAWNVLADRLSQQLLDKLVGLFRPDKQTSFRVPPSMREAWTAQRKKMGG